jgi:hypothetical protein
VRPGIMPREHLGRLRPGRTGVLDLGYAAFRIFIQQWCKLWISGDLAGRGDSQRQY